MRKIYFLFVLTLFLCTSLASQTQFEHGVSGARSAGMGNLGVTFTDTWAIINNPAGIAELDDSNLGVFYENRFQVSELGHGNILYNHQLGTGNVGVAISHFGTPDFNTNRFTAGYAQRLHEFITMGVNINYLGVFQQGFYGNIHGVTFDIGLISEPIEGLSFGFHAFNPANLSYLTDNNIKIPANFKLGAAYYITDDFLAAIETGMAINGDIPILKVGMEYLIYDHLFLRTGFSADPVEFSFGLGYLIENLQFDLAVSYHQFLGSSPKISLLYGF